jgi:mono/diheme cytochrome c family protein
MSRKILPIALIVGAALAPLPVQAEPRIVLNSVHVNLPTSGEMFPNGPNADVVNGNCVACHSIDMVLNQPDMPKAGWEAEVNKMRNVYKAPVAAEDVGAIVDYLTQIKGTK